MRLALMMAVSISVVNMLALSARGGVSLNDEDSSKPSQEWQIAYLGDGLFEIRNVASGYPLDHDKGANVILYDNATTALGSNAQRWKIQPVNEDISPSEICNHRSGKETVVRIINFGNGDAMDYTGKLGSQSAVLIKDDSENRAQQWIIKRLPNRMFSIQNQRLYNDRTGKFLEGVP